MTQTESADRGLDGAVTFLAHEIVENGRDPWSLRDRLVRQGMDGVIADRLLFRAIVRIRQGRLRGDYGYFELFWAVTRKPFACGWLFRLLACLTVPVTLGAAFVLVARFSPSPLGLNLMAAATIAFGFVFWCACLVLVYLTRQGLIAFADLRSCPSEENEESFL